MTADDSVANAVGRFNDGVDDTSVNIVEVSEDVDDAEVDARVNNGVDAEADNANKQWRLQQFGRLPATC